MPGPFPIGLNIPERQPRWRQDVGDSSDLPELLEVVLDLGGECRQEGEMRRMPGRPRDPRRGGQRLRAGGTPRPPRASPILPTGRPTTFPEEPPPLSNVVVSGHPDDSPRAVRLVPPPPEPWFYRYLVIYALVLAGLALFQFVIVTLFVLYVFFTTTPNPRIPAGAIYATLFTPFLFLIGVRDRHPGRVVLAPARGRRREASPRDSLPFVVTSPPARTSTRPFVATFRDAPSPLVIPADNPRPGRRTGTGGQPARPAPEERTSSRGSAAADHRQDRPARLGRRPAVPVRSGDRALAGFLGAIREAERADRSPTRPSPARA